MTILKNPLDECDLNDLCRLHDALQVIGAVAGGETSKAGGSLTPRVQYLEQLHDEIDDKLNELEIRINRHKAASYEEAMIIFKSQCYCVQDADDHYLNVLQLLKHVRAEAA